MAYPYKSDAERLHTIREFYQDRPIGDVMFLVGIIDDLLTALKRIDKLADDWHGPCPNIQDVARAAIAKAEGK
jgi:hypothetical protein